MCERPSLATDLLNPLLARAIESVPDAVGAGIGVCDQDGGRRVAAVGCAEVLDDLQWRLWEGPAPSATDAFTVVASANLRSDERWPRLGEELSTADVADADHLAVVARPGPWPGYGFTVFTFYLHQLPPHEVLNEIAQYEAPAAVALAAIEAQNSDWDDLMRSVVHARGAIEQAKGIIEGHVRCSPDEAFDVLRLASQEHNVKVRDVAAALVHHVTEPANGAPGPSSAEKVARILWESLPR